MRALAAAAALLVLLTGEPSPHPAAACVSPPRPATLVRAVVTRVIDGDTIQVRLRTGPSERVRLLGIDAPEVYDSARLDRTAQSLGKSREEIRALGRLAWNFTRSRLERRVVSLELDVQTRDAYGRLLAYVWLGDGPLFNMVILQEGYAQVLTIPPNVRYADLFLACQREARRARRGLWGD
jgi:micrococcal nuclease